MLSTKAEFEILPGKEEEAIAAIVKLIEAVEREEPGCILYRWHRGTKEPNHIMVFELWRDLAAVDEHRGMAHMKEFGSLFGSVFDPASVKIERYELIGEVRR
jgi:quinol monooxygenase YgiN